MHFGRCSNRGSMPLSSRRARCFSAAKPACRLGIERDAACVMPSVSMTRALSLQWTARCVWAIPRDGLRFVEPLRYQDEATRIS
jgi:hypothetical protein